ncbi:hypothetical protein SAMN05443572_111302 [Myxococcus fulvus]|uniref:GH16 domain-containing protein n=1 Tax=Myxococcus fulvus TaxID=33 RepID=A0A511TCX0_MYXFU|nr:hypothetical protein MFU01_70670 [Myxococcus fulvus]SEU36767.1 hypothetical protein SAMN05443572_111302 [Myxococcus fulvus]
MNRALRPLRLLPVFSLAYLAACQGTPSEEGNGVETGETVTSALVSSSLSPTRDEAMSGIWAGGGSAPIHGLMDDGVSFAASDRGGSFARSAPARASSSLTLGYQDSAVPGGASNVVVNYDGWAINGGTGTLRVKLYEGATLLGTGPLHVLGTTPGNFSDTFANLDVADAGLLRTELLFENSAAAGSLVSSIIWLDVTGRASPVTTLECPAGFTRELFRDDFDGSALDATKWDVIQGNNNPSGGAFTQLTKMLRANVKVEGGRLKVSSKRHCVDPYPNITPENPARCAGTNYYSGAWLKGKGTFAPGKGLMAFHAKMPPPMPGTFPALWARNSFGDARYGELDLIETWWDSPKGTANDPNRFSATTHVGSSPMIHTSNNEVGPFANLVTASHVWEVEWDAGATPAVARYYYRDSLGSTRILVRTATYQTSGFNGRVTDAAFRTALADGWRPYIDFAVQPEGTWNVGPDTAAVYDPQDLEVDSVIICAP